MTLYHRYTSKDTPMSDWGHSMFAEDQDAVAGGTYGDNHWTYDGAGAPYIQDLERDVKAAWALCQETGDWGQLDDQWLREMTADEVFAALNPADIVNSADGWDSDLMIWFWDWVAEPQGLGAVITQDGAIVWDEQLIKRA